jgi:hypothetical protein
MRFRAPARGAVAPTLFDTAPFADVARWRHWLASPEWPSLDALDAVAQRLPVDADQPRYRVVEQSPALLADGLHYESRIARTGRIASRPRNWHDLLNLLIWLRFPLLKQALNRRQANDVERFGSRHRSRGQCALTHFDEAGVVLVLRDRSRLDAWDRHDWCGLFAGLDRDGYAVAIIGHALLEHALDPGRLLCGKALAVLDDDPATALPRALDSIAAMISGDTLLRDPQELRPLPLMGLPGWHPDAGDPAFLRSAPCFQPLRAGRRYPPASSLASDAD